MLDYHQGEGGQRIRNRRRLAQSLEVPMNALRIRVHRLRSRLEACVRDCMDRSQES